MFTPREYLDTYYKEVDSENHELLTFWHNIPLKGTDSVLEIGCGPTIFTAIPLIMRCKSIFLSDALHENIIEIQRWKDEDPQAFNWTPTINHYVHNIAGMDGIYRWSINERLHNHIHLTHINLRDKETFLSSKFNMITMPFVLEAASKNRRDFKLLFKNVLQMLEPDGIVGMVIAACGNRYKLGNQWLSMCYIEESTLYDCFIQNEFTEIHSRIIPISEERGYKKIITIWGKR